MVNRHSKWRKAHPKVRNACRARNYAKSKPPVEVIGRRPSGIKHLPWSDDEKMFILQNKDSDRDKARFLGRSVEAIQSMRYIILKALK